MKFTHRTNTASRSNASGAGFQPDSGTQAGCPRHKAAFTLAEVLAALVFMAIVIPVAVQGLRIASRAGVVAERKREAARVAERVLNETIVTTNWNKAAQNGTVQEGEREYRWTLRTESWSESAMQLLTAEVVFPAQGQDYAVRLSTLVSSQ